MNLSNIKADALLGFILSATLACMMSSCKTLQFTDWVNPMIGTGGHGHTFPGACYPFGMMQLSPDTRLEGWDGCSGYHDSDHFIYGFSHTHLSGTGIPDYGDFLIMPGSGPFHDSMFSNQNYRSSFSKSSEKASPGYYSVLLNKDQILVELTVGLRTGMHQYQFKERDPVWVIVDLTHRDPLISAKFTKWHGSTLEAFRISSSWAKKQQMYFTARFSQPIQQVLFNKDSMKMAIFFAPGSESQILIHSAISAVDQKGANHNLLSEWNDFDFVSLMKRTRNAWNQHLGRIAVETQNVVHIVNFYTALYHCLVHPSLFQDVDGRYLDMDGVIRQAPKDDHFTVFSLWDTYRSTHPLYQLVYPDYNLRFIRTFLRQFKASGHLPVWELAANETWCMIGHHSIPVIANAWAHRNFDFDTALAKRAVFTTLTKGNYSGLPFMCNGFISSNESAESVSKTIENCLDFAAAKDMGVELPEFLHPRAYQNLYNPGTGFFQAKRNHSFLETFDPREVNFHYTEANAYQYLFGAHHDAAGLVSLFGGRMAMERKLDQLFTDTARLSGREQADITGLIGQYAHGNEPSHHVAYLYNYTNAQYKTQAILKRIMDNFYDNRPDGLIGNEDCGQMSSWYVFSALGFYPLHPFNAQYELGFPLFQKATIRTPGKKKIQFKLKSIGNPKWVESFAINGKETFFQFNLNYGDHLEFRMGSKPLTKLQQEPSELDNFLALPYVSHGHQVFEDSVSIVLSSPDGLPMEYCKDSVTQDPEMYMKAIHLKNSGKIYFRHKTGDPKGIWLQAEFFRKPKGIKLHLFSDFANQYAASGKDALIDGVSGGTDFRDGLWQGYQGQDVNLMIELDTNSWIEQCRIRFLQDQGSWILLPKKLLLQYSTDGVQYLKSESQVHQVPLNHEGAIIHEFVIPVKQNGKYLKIEAINAGLMPEWHLGAGGKSWLFCDEIIIDKK